MALVEKYIAEGGVSGEELNALLVEYPWFAAAKALQERSEGKVLRHAIDAEKIAEESEGEIVGYTSTTSSVSSGEYALQNRLTITVKVNFTNVVDEKASFKARTFSAYADYDSTKLLNEVESTLIPEIVEQIVTDIFMAAASNW